MDFAASLMPGWQETIFPPYFVIGAMFSGFAMVVTLAILLRRGLGLEEVINARHFDAMGRIVLAGSVAMGISYLTEWFTAWYGGGRAERTHLGYLFAGDYAPLYFIMLFCNVLAPQILWLRWTRRNLVALFVVTIVINVGMWLERILIIWNTLSLGHLPSMHHVFYPTFWDWATLGCSIGFFAFLFLCFVRIFPAVAMHDLNKRLHGEKVARA
jgi:molybdopterin-containing oxidoreductase family membrane subunit